MLPITLVRDPLKFYTMQAVGFIIISGIGVGISWASAEGINSPDVGRNDYLFLFIGLVFVFLAFHMVIKYFKNARLIKADDSTIIFHKGDVYSLKDIEHIQFTGKVPFPILLLNFPFEGTCILFKNGTKKYVYDDLYSNAWELKSFLKQTVVDMKAYEPTIAQGKINEADINEIEFFRGNPILSFSPIMLWGLISLIIFGAFKIAQKDGPWIIMVVVAIFLFIALSSSMTYFGLSENYFIVKNYHFFWKKHIYRIDNIKEIVFETYPKSTICLRIITHDFRTKVYSACTLREKHWLGLMENLKEKGIVVRDECIRPNG